MRKYETVLFDLDGTLTESGEGIINSAVYALKKFGIEPEMSQMGKFLGPPLKDSFRDFYGFSEEKCVEAVKYYREYYTTKGIFENKVYEGVEDCLKALKSAGLKLAVATSKPQVFAVKILEHFHLVEYFDFIGGAELDGTRSVKAEVITHTLKNCGADDRSNVIMVGDRKHDVLGAKALGMDCIGVLYGYGSREELESAGAVFIADTPMAVADYTLRAE
ncbi:HAD family hydrolase [Ruminococcus sp.]|uniref:HAD family hydrolase n=1 Tax=Ruminococcus sp. TaxID=41978 RepID=UPI0025CC44A3|nr:HAD family hydrolase [Ruminococcus sp.]